MFLVSITQANTSRGIFTGGLCFVRVQAGQTTTGKRLMLPPNTHGLARYACQENYGNRQYVVGGYTENLVVDEEFRVHHQGMRAPDAVPSVSVGGGTTLQLCYTRFFDEVTGERSPLSDSKSVTGNTTRAWTSLPTEVPNERIVIEGTVTFAGAAITGVKTNFGDLRLGDRIAISTDLTRWAQIRDITDTFAMTIDDAGMVGAGVKLVCRPFSRASHVELWVSVDGSLPRLAARVRIGVASFTESVPTNALGIPETMSFESMPRGEINVMYNDRQAIAGVERHRDTVFLSAIGFPERHEGLRFVTKYNEPIVGMLKFADFVIVLCPKSSYKLQGYTEDDYTLEVLDPDVGGLGHHGNKMLGNVAYIPWRYGVNVFNGAFHKGMSKRRNEWIVDYAATAASRTAYEEGFGIINPNDETYQFYPKFGGGIAVEQRATVWVGHYGAIEAEVGGALVEPTWTTDSVVIQTNLTYAVFAAYLSLPGEKTGAMYRITDAPIMFVEADTTAFQGTAIHVSKHLLMDDPGGDETEGKELVRLWSYIRMEDSAGEVRVHQGSEYCYPPDFYLTQPNIHVALFKATIPATFNQVVEVGVGTRTYEPKTVHPQKPGVDGYGFTIEHRFLNPKNVRLMGFGGEWGPGAASAAQTKILIAE